MTGSSIASAAAAVVPGALRGAPPAANPPGPPMVGRDDGGASGPRSAKAVRPVTFGPMRGVFWKEIQENIKTLVYLLLALAGGAFAALWFETYAFARSPNQDSVLFSSALQWLSALACPVGALVLANFQGFNERSQDIRAFTRHRAISPNRLFLAKCAAGLMLYFVALGLPMVILVAYAALAPKGGFLFDIRFARPFAADFVTGIAYYFAGFLVAQRQARWYASRVLPIPAAIAASVGALALHEFRQAMGAALCCAAFLAIAAWHNFIHGGVDAGLGLAHEGARSSGGRRWRTWADGMGSGASAAVMAAGLTVVLMAVFQLVELALDDWIKMTSPGYDNVQFQKPSQATSYSSESYGTLPDGYPMRVKEIGRSSPDTGWIYSQEYRDLRGNPLPSAATQPDFDYSTGTRAGFYPAEYQYAVEGGSYRDESSLVEVVAEGGQMDDPKNTLSQRWYYVRPWGYFVGFNPKTRHTVGSIGDSGVVPPSLPGQPFTPPLTEFYMSNSSSEFEAISGNRLLYFDFLAPDPQRRMKILLATPDGRPIRMKGGITVADSLLPDPTKSHTAVTQRIAVTDQYLYFFNPSGNGYALQAAIPLEYPLANYVVYIRTALPHRIAIRYWRVDQAESQHHLIYTDDGKLIERIELPRLSSENNKWDYRAPTRAESVGIRIIGLIDSLRNPLLLEPIRYLLHPVENYGFAYDRIHVYGDPNRRDLPPWLRRLYFEGLVPPMLLAVVMTFCLSRRYGCSRLGIASWTLAVLLTGPVGLLTFLATQPRAARVQCGSCGKKRLVTRVTCEHCGAPFPPPAQNGTEVFA